MIVVDEHRNVDVALAARAAAGPASVQPGKAHRRVIVQSAGKTIAEVVNVASDLERDHYVLRPVGSSLPCRELE